MCRVVGGDGERSRKWSEDVGMAAHRTVLAETWMWRRMSMVIKEGWCDGIDSQLFYSTEVSLYPVALSGSSRLTKQQR
eukprot:SAG25_NODE_969_length_4493_cov_4.706190_4_plen_78_part_00